MRCTACQQENRPGARFCDACGTRLAPRCAACGEELRAEARFCSACGTPVSGTGPPEPTPRVEAGRSLQVAEAAPLRDERRLVSVLFCDLAGFTARADQADPEDVRDEIGRYLAATAEVIRAHGGTVDKYIGDAVMAVFGAPVAHEDDADRAIGAALAIHAAVTPLSFTVRIGIASGEAVAGAINPAAQAAYTVVGDVVNTAQRLESVCPPGRTLVAESTRRLARGPVRYGKTETLTLKGKAAPVVAYELLGRGTSDPGPATTPHFLGRERELAELTAALAEARAGRSARVLITGEPGAGKSRLLAEARQQAGSLLWLEGRCPSYGASLSNSGIASALRSWLGFGEQAWSAEVQARLTVRLEELQPENTAGLLRDLGRILGAPEESVTSSVFTLSPEALRRRLTVAVRSLVTALTERGPVVLVLEDLHWADPFTLDVLDALAAPPMAAGLALTGTARPEHDSARLQAWSELGGEDGMPVLEIRLDRLSRAACDALVHELLPGSPAGDDLTSAVWEQTGGNPLFVEQVIRALREREGLRLIDGRWRLRPEAAGLTTPDTVHGMILARIDRLPVAARLLLQTASVLGRSFVPGDVLGLQVQGVDPYRDAPRLVEAGFLRVERDGDSEATYHFVHALTQEVAYSSLLRRTRRDLHRRAGISLETRLGGHVDALAATLARHFSVAERWDKAGHYLLMAGDQARAVFANAEALEHYQRAAESLERSGAGAESRARALARAGDVAEVIGEYERAVESLSQALDLTTEPELQASIHCTIASVQRRRGEFAPALATLEQGAGALEDRHAPATRARIALGTGQVRFQTGDVDGAILAYERGLDELADTAPVVETALLHARLGSAYGRRGDWERAMAHHHRAVEISRAVEDLPTATVALRDLGAALWRLSRWDDSVTALEEALSVAERTGDIAEIAAVQVNLANVLWARGQQERALTCLRQSLAIFDTLRYAYGQARAHINLAFYLAQRRELVEARAHCEMGLRTAGAIGHTMSLAQGLVNRATIWLEEGNAAACLTDLFAAQERYESVGARAYLAEIHRLRALALIAMGRLTEAEDEAGTALRLSEENSDVPEQALAQRALSRIALLQEQRPLALQRLRESLRLLQASGHLTEIEKTRALLQSWEQEPAQRVPDEDVPAHPG